MREALGIIDAQRGFMPASEASKYQLGGFGELGVENGEQIIEPINKLLTHFASRGLEIFSTQDWHPHDTAHFSETPDFNTNWPRHCVAGTPGAELHPAVILPATSQRFTKGFEALERGEDDLSYSGYYAEDPVSGRTLPEWLEARKIKKITLGGLALDYCVGKTALDLRQRMGLDVAVVLDASKAIAEESEKAILKDFHEAGIKTFETAEEFIRLRGA